ncbi:acyltransferase [Arthrobacter sp. S13_S34]|nr:acyltransferase [Arthrobacter sp. S13_S34]
MSNERRRWLDLVRGCAIIMVICHHSLYLTTMFLGVTPEPLRWLDRFWEPFRMPVLVFLSGMLLSKSLRKPPLPFVVGKVRALAWPYWLWSLIFLAMTNAITTDSLVRVLLVPPTYLWYLWYLFAFYLTALVFTRLGVPLAAVFIGVVVAAALVTPRFGLANFFYLAAFFLLGHLFALQEARVRQALSLWWGTAALACTAVGTAVASAAGMHVKFEAEWMVGVIAAAALAARFAPAVPVSRATKAVQLVGRNSMVFYLAHWPAMWAGCSLLVWLGVSWPWAYILLNLCLGVLAGQGMSALRRRVPASNALFVWPARKTTQARA